MPSHAFVYICKYSLEIVILTANIAKNILTEIEIHAILLAMRRG